MRGRHVRQSLSCPANGSAQIAAMTGSGGASSTLWPHRELTEHRWIPDHPLSRMMTEESDRGALLHLRPGISPMPFCAACMAPSKAPPPRRASPCSRLLGPEHPPFYEHERRISRLSCGPRIRRGRKISLHCGVPYPRYVRHAWPLGFVSHETRKALYFCQRLAPIFKPPGQPGYGDKRTS
jgi:hypothetical protein